MTTQERGSSGTNTGPTQERPQSDSDFEKGTDSDFEKGNELTPCPICGEPRGDETPCPHCGMD